MRAILILLAITTTVVTAGRHSAPHHSNPCIAQCTTDSGSAECATCCRTARHKVPWNCPVPIGSHGDHNPNRDTHNGKAAACCNGEWSAACWDEPSAANYEHSCDMCFTPNIFQPANNGCNGQWSTPACWSDGTVPTGGPANSDSAQCNTDIQVSGNTKARFNYLFLIEPCRIFVAGGSSMSGNALNFQGGEFATIILNGAAGEEQFNITQNPDPGNSRIRLGLGHATARFMEYNDGRTLPFTFIRGPTGSVVNDGTAPGRLILSSSSARQPQSGDSFVLEAGVGWVQVEVEGLTMKLADFTINGTVTSPPTKLTFVGPASFPDSSNFNITWNDVQRPQDSLLQFGSGVTFNAGLNAYGPGGLRVAFLSGSTLGAEGRIFLDKTGAATTQFVNDGATLQTGAQVFTPQRVTCTPACQTATYGTCQAPSAGCPGGVCAGVCLCVSTATIGYSANCQNQYLCTSCVAGALCSAANNVCSGCNSTIGGGAGGATYSTECNQICTAGYSGSQCNTFRTQPLPLATGAGRAVFTLATGTPSSVGSTATFITAVRTAVATASGVTIDRVSVAAITPSASGGAGWSITVDIAAPATASEPSVGAALVQMANTPPSAFGAITVPAGSLSCPGYTSCANANGEPGTASSLSTASPLRIVLCVAVVSVVFVFDKF